MDQSGSSRKITYYIRVEKKEIVKWEKETADLPNEYLVDLDDKHFRDAGFFTEDTVFHGIGKGAQAEVIAGVLSNDRFVKKVAIKRYRVSALEKLANGFTNLARELRNTQFLAHPNIVTMHDYFYQSFIDNKNTDELDFVYLVTERMDCSLDFYFKDLAKKNRKRDHRHVAALFVQLFRALDYLHQRGIMHRDLAPKNIGMKRGGFVIKLLDFGCSGETNSHNEVTLISQTTPIYQPLEVILEIGYDCKVDVWAAGLVGVEMLGKKLMCPNTKEVSINQTPVQAVKERILEVVGVPENRYGKKFKDKLKNEAVRASKLDDELETLITNSMDVDRQSLSRSNLKDFLEKTFTVNPWKRPTPADCLKHPYLAVMNANYQKDYLTPNDMETKNIANKKILKDLLGKFSRNYFIESERESEKEKDEKEKEKIERDTFFAINSLKLIIECLINFQVVTFL